MTARAALAAGLMLALAPLSARGQSTLERPPDLGGTWVSAAGVGQFHVVHRFWVTDPPARKVVNTPTFLAAAGLGRGLLAGLRYASSSTLVTGEFNETEAFARWRPLSEARGGDQAGAPVSAGGMPLRGVADVAVTGAWNFTARSADGELTVARSVGPVRLQLSARAFSAFAGGDAGAAIGGGAVWRLHRNVAVAGDVMTMASVDTTVAWGVGLQLRIPTTPHTVSLNVTNVNATTLQSSSFGGEQRLYGFEFTIPITFSRYFGGGGGAPAPAAPAGPGPGAAPPGSAADTAVVRMDNRLRFLPDTIRIRAGAAVRWENASDLIHTVTADPARAARASSVALPAGARPFDSGDLAPGAVYIRRFDVPGEYRYFCVPHELAGMVGVIRVEP